MALRFRTVNALPRIALAALLLPLYPGALQAQRDVRADSGPLVELWDRLDVARDYKGNLTDELRAKQCAVPENFVRTSFATMIEQYGKSLDDDPARPTRKDELRTLAGPSCPAGEPGCNFHSLLDDRNRRVAEEAKWGLREAVNDLMAGQTMVGNDLLNKGLRTRFPGFADDEGRTDEELLRDSATAFREALTIAGEILRQRRDVFRPSGTVNETYPFFVENTAKRQPDGTLTPGAVVENEFYRYTELVQRSALAATALGRKQFLYGHLSEDNKLSGKKRTRKDAVPTLKATAQSTYLHTVLLTSLQSTDDLRNNNGHELKRDVVDAQHLFDDIVNGVNPFEFQGDFIPSNTVERYYSDLTETVKAAVVAEAGVIDASYKLDTNKTALETEFQTQRTGNLEDLIALTDIGDVETAYDLGVLEDTPAGKRGRNSFFAAAEANLRAERGELGNKQRDIRLAVVDFQIAAEQVRQIPERIRIEEERNGQVAKAKRKGAGEIAALDIGIAVASAIPSVSFGSGGASFSLSPGAVVADLLRREQNIVRAMQDIDIDGINSAATVKNLLLEQAAAYLAAERATVVIQTRQAELSQLRARLQRAVRYYLSARQNLLCAYFSNPAYRVQYDNALDKADNALRRGIEQAYEFAKALEYQWAERFENPIRIPGSSEKVTLTGYENISRAESVFAVRSAGVAVGAGPSLTTFLDALVAWDLKLRDLRRVESVERVKEFSVRKKILGFDSCTDPPVCSTGDPAFDRLEFEDFIARHRVPVQGQALPDLEFEFQIQIADQYYFDFSPNLKIDSIEVTLRSLENRPLRTSSVNPVTVDLIMRDTATLRTFFANPDAPNPENRLDDLLFLKLAQPQRDFEPFLAEVDARTDCCPQIQPPNPEHANRSPAVSRWVLRIRMGSGTENSKLRLENLDDIILKFHYRTGKPRDFFASAGSA
jgi:hypothetical protein